MIEKSSKTNRSKSSAVVAKRKEEEKAEGKKNKKKTKAVEKKREGVKCSSGRCRMRFSKRYGRKVKLLSYSSRGSAIELVSHEEGKWTVDSMDGEKDSRKKNVSKVKVDLELVNSSHIEPIEEVPGNFRTSPYVRVDGRKFGRFHCSYCKTVSFSTFAATATEALVHNLTRHKIDDLKFSVKARLSMRMTSINIYMNMKDMIVKKKFGITDAKDREEVNGFHDGDSKIVAWLIKKLLLNCEAKNVFTLEAIMKEDPETYEEFIDAIEHEMKEKLIENWRTEGSWRSLVEGCVTLRVKPTDLMGYEQLRSFSLEFTAPAMMNEIIKEIIETKLCLGIR